MPLNDTLRKNQCLLSRPNDPIFKSWIWGLFKNYLGTFFKTKFVLLPTNVSILLSKYCNIPYYEDD